MHSLAIKLRCLMYLMTHQSSLIITHQQHANRPTDKNVKINARTCEWPKRGAVRNLSESLTLTLPQNRVCLRKTSLCWICILTLRRVYDVFAFKLRRVYDVFAFKISDEFNDIFAFKLSDESMSFLHSNSQTSF